MGTLGSRAPERASRSTAGTAAGVPGRLVLLMAVACGAAVGNNYLVQPLLDLIARDLHVSTVAAGLLVTASQAGYAAGLVLVVPLGDLLPRRPLVVTLLLLTAGGLALAAAAPAIGALAAAVVLFGVTSVVAQVLVPLSADLAPESDRGRVVGRVMSGLLIGILLARTLAGLLAAAAGWRWVYGAAALVAVALAVLLGRALPALPAGPAPGYGALLRSALRLARTERRLWAPCAYGSLTFASFATFWTSIAFLLAGPPFGYGTAVIGLFGLAGLVGAAAAAGAGHLHDRGWGRPAAGVLLACTLIAWLPLTLTRHSLLALVIGVVVLDLGIQGVHILNQSRIYAIGSGIRSRLTTVYMTTYFMGGIVGSSLSAVLHGRFGWTAVGALGIAFPTIALAIWLAEPRLSRASAARAVRR